ncbi:hypothetical protein ACG3SL_00735 [Sphingomonas sp. CJ20]
MSASARRILLWGLAVLGLLAAGAVLFLAVSVTRLAGGRTPDPAPVEAKTPGEQFAVAEVNALAGTPLSEIVIATEASVRRGSGGPYSGGQDTDARNVVLLDKTTGANRKLLADNSRHIAARYYLPALEGPEEPIRGDYTVASENPADGGKPVVPPRAYVVLVVDALDRKSQDVLIGDLRTGQQAFVLKSIDGLDRLWMQSPTRMGILMRQGKRLQYRAIDLPTLKSVAAQTVDIG